MKNVMILSKALTFGGAERAAAALAGYMAKECNCILVVIDDENKTYESDAKIITLKQSVVNKGHGLALLLWFVKLFFKVRKIRRDYKIDECISFLTEPDLINILTGSKKSKSTISVRNLRSAVVKGKIKRLRDKWLFKKANRIVATSKMVKDDLIKVFGANESKIDVVYNICDQNRILNAAQEDCLDDEEKAFFETGDVVVTTGRLTGQKGHWHLIRAFSAVVKEHPNAKLAILGQGELNDYLQQLIDDYSLNDSVRILGFKKNPYAYLNKAKIFAFSSFFEGCPNAILEAYAVGLPVVTTDGVGIREIVAPETHYAKKTDCLERCSYGVLTPVCDGEKYDANEPLTQGEIELQKGISLLLSNQDCIEHYKLMSKERIGFFTKESILGKWIRQ